MTTRDTTRCEVCKAPRRGDGGACTNARCGACHRALCTPGGSTSPGHGLGDPKAIEARQQRAVMRYMVERAPEHRAPVSGEVLLTELSEDAAHHFDSDGWLDDPDHWVWELAIQAAEEVEA